MSSANTITGGGADLTAPSSRTGLVSPLNPSVAAFEYTSPSSSVPSSPSRASVDGDEDNATALKRHLSYYFSDQNLAKDAFLVSHMNADMYVPCTLVASFRAIKSRTTDLVLVVEVLRTLDNVEVDDEGTMVRPKNYMLLQSPRGTLIVQDVPTKIKKAGGKVKKLFQGGPNPVTIQADTVGRWFVTFEGGEEASQTALKLLEGKSIDGNLVSASIKVQGPLLRGGGVMAPAFSQAGAQMVPNQGMVGMPFPGYFDPQAQAFAFYGQQPVMSPYAYAYAPGMVPSYQAGAPVGMVPGQGMNFARMNPAQFQPNQSGGSAQQQVAGNNRRTTAANGSGRQDQSRRQSGNRNGNNTNQPNQPQQPSQHSQAKHRRSSSTGSDTSHSSKDNANTNSNSGSRKGKSNTRPDNSAAAHVPKNKKPTKPAATDTAQQIAPTKKKKEPVKQPAPELALNNFPSLGGKPSSSSKDAPIGWGSSGGENFADIAKRKMPGSPTRDPKPPSVPPSTNTASVSGGNNASTTAAPAKKPAAAKGPGDKKTGSGSGSDTPASLPKLSVVDTSFAIPPNTSQPPTHSVPADKPTPAAAKPVQAPPKVKTAPAPKKPAWGKPPTKPSAAAIVPGRVSISDTTISAPKPAPTPSISQASSATTTSAVKKASHVKKSDAGVAQPKAPVAVEKAPAKKADVPTGIASVTNAEPKQPLAGTTEAPKSVWGQSAGRKPSFAEMLKAKNNS